MRQKKHIVFVKNVLSHYNVPLYALLAESSELKVTVVCHRTEMSAEEAEKCRFEIMCFPRSKAASWIVKSAGINLPSIGVVRYVVSMRPDIVTIDGLSSVGSAVLLCTISSRMKWPIIWWSLGTLPGRKRRLRQHIGDWIQKYCTKRVGAVLAYSTFAARYFEEIGVPRQKIVVGHNTLDERKAIWDSQQVSSVAVEEIRQRLGFKGCRVCVFCGTINKGKRVDVLLRAFARIVDEQPTSPYRLLVIGDGPDRGEAERLSAKLGIKAVVSFVGGQSEKISRYFLVSDFCVLPGLGGLAINHAFAHGLPVICGPADGTEMDLVKNGKTGFLLPTVSEETLVAAMRRLFEDAEGCRVLGEGAKELISRRFTIGHYRDRLLEAMGIALTNLKTARYDK